MNQQVNKSQQQDPIGVENTALQYLPDDNCHT